MLIDDLSMYGRKRVYAPAPGSLYSAYRRPLKKARYSLRGSTSKVRVMNRFVDRGLSSSGSLSQQVKSLQSAVRKLQPELKYVDTSLAQSNITAAAGAVTHITAVGQGDTQSTRTGNSIRVKSVDVGFYIPRNGITSIGFDTFFRWAIVQDKQQVADTAPVAGGIFTSAATPWVDFPQEQSLERYRFLYVSPCIDLRQVSFAVAGSWDNAVFTKSNQFSYCWKGDIKVDFNGGASTDMQKNNLYVVFMCFGMDTMDIVGTSRVGYTDV